MNDNERERYERAKAQVGRVRGFYTHATVFVLVNLALLAINLITNPHGLWFYWPLLAWGVGLAVHAFTVFGPSRVMGQDWEDRKIRELMERERHG